MSSGILLEMAVRILMAFSSEFAVKVRSLWVSPLYMEKTIILLFSMEMYKFLILREQCLITSELSAFLYWETKIRLLEIRKERLPI